MAVDGMSESSRTAGERFRARMEAPPRSAAPSVNAEAGPSTQRKVRTVPPHAAFEPTTPPSPARPSNDSTLVNPVPAANLDQASGTSTPHKVKRRPRPKLRYSTSESSYDDTDDSASDDEPPWWTFTQRGMHKLKLRNLRLQEAGQSGALGTDDSGREDKTPRRKPGKRRSSGYQTDKDKDKEKRRGSNGRRGTETSKKSSTGPGAGAGAGVGVGSKEPTPRASERNLKRSESPKPMRPPLALPPNMRMSTPAFLKSKRADSGVATPPVKIKMKRRYSAPSSPVPDDQPIPSIALITSPTDANGQPRPVALHESLPIRPVSSTHSILSLPRPPFLKRHSESLTDTEAVASHSVRQKAKRAQSNVQDREDSQVPESGTSTPMRRGKERKQTMSRLKLNFQDQMSQHFSHGWPHAGTWQDALYGYYDEVPKDRDKEKELAAAESRRSSKDHGNHNNNNKNRSASIPHHTHEGAVVTTPTGTEHPSDSASPAPRPMPARRAKSRRRKYRQALMPPTPSGLGFTAAERGEGNGPTTESWKQGRVVDDEFDWGLAGAGEKRNGHDRNRITEESGELSRTETRQTAMEKPGTVSKKEKAKTKVKGKLSRNDGMDWKQRFRRVMFLDARVTIWIRFANLAVVVCSLALAITIRNELSALRLPGLVGPSTTLVIAYSSLTIIHIFVAVYREYFGRPIGLWGLRSKMLWVCLDLLFVALWSSALTLQINDLIDTPLDCVAQAKWWEEGRASEYTQLLDDLELLRANGATPQDLGISDSLDVQLPDEITASSFAREACRRQEGGIALALMTLLLYGGNMVLSLFRIFETVRRTAHVDRAVMF